MWTLARLAIGLIIGWWLGWMLIYFIPSAAGWLKY